MYHASQHLFGIDSVRRDVSHEAGAIHGLVNALPLSLVLWAGIAALVEKLL